MATYKKKWNRVQSIVIYTSVANHDCYNQDEKSVPYQLSPILTDRPDLYRLTRLKCEHFSFSLTSLHPNFLKEIDDEKMSHFNFHSTVRTKVHVFRSRFVGLWKKEIEPHWMY